MPPRPSPPERSPDKPVRPTEEQLRLCFDRQTWAQGEDYQRRGRVFDLDMDDGAFGTGLTSSVQGSAGQFYSVFVELAAFESGIVLDGQCTCSIRHHCKHAAATVLQALRRGWFAPDGAPPPSLRQHRIAPGKPVSTVPFINPLTGTLGNWLDTLEQAATETPVTKPSPSPRSSKPSLPVESILYCLNVQHDPDGKDFVALSLVAARPLKDGGWGAERACSLGQVAQSVARMIRDIDRTIARVLSAEMTHSLAKQSRINPATLEWVMEQILTTGRAYWQTKDGVQLSRGPDQPGRLCWRLTPQGNQILTLEAEIPGLVALTNSRPWVLDPETGQCGQLLLPIPTDLLAVLLDAPPVPPEAAQGMATVLQQRLPHLPLPPPRADVAITVSTEPPAPILWLDSKRLPPLNSWKGRRSPLPAEEWIDGAWLSFRYAGEEISRDTPSTDLRQMTDNGVLIHKRRPDREKAAVQRLAGYGLMAPISFSDSRIQTALANGGLSFPLVPDPSGRGNLLDETLAWPDFVHHKLPELKADGWEIRISDTFRHRMVSAQGEWQADVEDKGGWWFSLDLGIEVDGERLPLLPVLISALARLKPGRPLDELAQAGTLYGQLPDGRTLALPFARVRRLVEVLVELFGDRPTGTGTQIDLSLAQAMGLEAIAEATRIRWVGGERLRMLAQHLRDGGISTNCPVPDTFRATLRPYQHTGFCWLQFLARQGLGGILADDMGLGKTVQTLAHILAEKESGRMSSPFLVVAPTSLIPTWRDEAARFAPDLRVVIMHGLNRPRNSSTVAGADLVITTYPLLTRDESLLLRITWHGIVLDEAQAIKNPATKWTQAAGRLKAGHRLCLTGTPVENHLGEAWSQFNFLMPGLLGDNRTFSKVFRTPIEKRNDAERRTALSQRLKPFLLRRRKSDVATELPPKTEVIRRVELAGGQRDLYETLRLTMDSKVRQAVAAKGLSRSAIVILEALLKLRQACCDPRLVKLRGAAPSDPGSAKLEHLMEFLPELVEEGRRILLFSQFTSMLDLIKPALNQAGIAFVELTGDTTDRAAPVRIFQSGAVPVFLISLKTGGVGLTLTAADTVIHYDPWWNPAVEDQATDRAHRIGQDKPVFVYKLIAAGTVEERMLELQTRKRAIATALFDPDVTMNDAALAFSEADLIALFQPIEP